MNRKERRANNMGSFRVLSETTTETTFGVEFNGHTIRVVKNKFTGEQLWNMEDMAIAAGKSPEDAKQWLESDAGLDAILKAQDGDPIKKVIHKR